MIAPILAEDAELPPGDVVFADVRWYLDGRSGREAYERGHLPGAVFVDLDTALADHDRPATEGRHPFPTPEAFAAAMCALGIGDRTTVLAYDDSGGGTAGRLVWMLRILGHPAALLDGGIRWRSLDLESGPSPAPAPADFTVRPWPPARFATADDVAALAAAGHPVFDARSGDRYRGETEPVDRRAGHIPGAANAPWSSALDPETGRFRPGPAQIARLTEALVASRPAGSSVSIDSAADGPGAGGADGLGGAVCYCGSGVSACANLLALESAGVHDARLYVASWSGWSADPARPVATGH